MQNVSSQTSFKTPVSSGNHTGAITGNHGETTVSDHQKVDLRDANPRSKSEETSTSHSSHQVAIDINDNVEKKENGKQSCNERLLELSEANYELFNENGACRMACFFCCVATVLITTLIISRLVHHLENN